MRGFKYAGNSPTSILDTSTIIGRVKSPTAEKPSAKNFIGSNANRVNIWIIVTLLGVLAMLLGPNMMLQLQAGERRQVRLRSAARELGLRVSMGALPRRSTDMANPRQMAVYCLPRKDSKGASIWMLVRTAYAHEQHFLQHWDWANSGRPNEIELQRLARLVPELPASVAGLSAGRSGWCCYWNERGDEQTLVSLKQVLEELAGEDAERAQDA